MDQYIFLLFKDYVEGVVSEMMSAERVISSLYSQCYCYGWMIKTGGFSKYETDFFNFATSSAKDLV